jgi:hypothetical protein
MQIDSIIKIWYESRRRDKFTSNLKKQGFCIVGYGDRSLVLSKPEIDFVVKVSDRLPTRRFREPELEKFRLPYIFLSENKRMGIQAKVNVGRRAKYLAFRKINEATQADLAMYDIHLDNIGFLKRRPVIFDYV